MSEPIKVGDLVMVVRPTTCCGSTASVGHIDRVIGYPFTKTGFCGACRKEFPHGPDSAVTLSDGLCCFRSRLKRIAPPSDEMKRETQKEIENV